MAAFNFHQNRTRSFSDSIFMIQALIRSKTHIRNLIRSNELSSGCGRGVDLLVGVGESVWVESVLIVLLLLERVLLATLTALVVRTEQIHLNLIKVIHARAAKHLIDWLIQPVHWVLGDLAHILEFMIK